MVVNVASVVGTKAIQRIVSSAHVALVVLLFKKLAKSENKGNLLLPAVLGLVLVGETRVERGGLEGEGLLLGRVGHFDDVSWR